MDIRELSRGFWVTTKIGEVGRVDEIVDDSVKLQDGGLYDPTFVYPIAVTTEMLELNDIDYEVYSGYICVRVRKEGAKDKYANGHFPFKGVILDDKVIYVHEVQRALIACGYLTEAMTFKIK